jgi:Tfp pilus assembly PilM family ATPase
MAKASGPVLGLDIGSSFIKLVEITAKGSHRELTAVAVMSTPADAVIQGLIIDPPSMGQVLRHLVEVSGARSRRVISSVG